jgi:hypothetical protein
MFRVQFFKNFRGGRTDHGKQVLVGYFIQILSTRINKISGIRLNGLGFLIKIGPLNVFKKFS